MSVSTRNFIDIENPREPRLVPARSLPPYARYAVLSHRWGEVEQELSFHDLRDGRITVENLLGWQKLENFAQIMHKYNAQGHFNCRYLWIDSCCIDQSHSPALEENIRSMYRLYGEAVVCIAYLNDVRGDTPYPESNCFAESAWFRRGWTLQELIVPSEVYFFDQAWSFIGTRSTMSREIARITRIDWQILSSYTHISQYSVAARMSYVAGRETTRPEDLTYCLLGIFDVQIPIFYGEGARSAFHRLQKEIIREYDDDSILAWTKLDSEPSSFLADSPSAFAACSSVTRYSTDNEQLRLEQERSRKPYVLTNRGLTITLNLLPWAPRVYEARLRCISDSRRKRIYLGMLGDGRFVRTANFFQPSDDEFNEHNYDICKWVSSELGLKDRTIVICHSLSQFSHTGRLFPRVERVTFTLSCRIISRDGSGYSQSILQFNPDNHSVVGGDLSRSGNTGLVCSLKCAPPMPTEFGLVEFYQKDWPVKSMCFGIDALSKPVVCLSTEECEGFTSNDFKDEDVYHRPNSFNLACRLGKDDLLCMENETVELANPIYRNRCGHFFQGDPFKGLRRKLEGPSWEVFVRCRKDEEIGSWLLELSVNPLIGKENKTVLSGVRTVFRRHAGGLW